MSVVLLSGAAMAQDNEPGFQPIFDGKTLNGWKGQEGRWQVVDGAIVGETTEANPLPKNTFLVWDDGTVDDFELRLQFRISGSDRANSGIQFRGTQREDGHVVGYQADIDRARQWVGALYDEATGRGALAKRGFQSIVNAEGKIETKQVNDPAEIFSKIDLDGWNEYSISARGNHIVNKINGNVTVDVTDNDPNGLDRSGLLALQLHTGPPMKIEFRKIRLKRFPLEKPFKKVVFVAGSKSHGYFSHEHNAGCLLLAKQLEESGLPVVASVYLNGWPKDPTAFDNADTVVSYCDGGGRHYLNNHLEDFDYLVDKRGVGLVCIHYAVETVTGPPGEHFLKWMGGFFEIDWSVNPHWTAKFDKFPKHPISSGVKPFEINDEWYYHMRFVPEMKNVTPVLSALPPRETLNRPDGHHSGNPHVRAAVMERKETQHVAWAYDRPDNKGRGFGFTGGHFHKNWQDDNFRKLVLNAIVWTANGDVPSDGVPSKTPTQEELEKNQDYPKPGEKKNVSQGKPNSAIGPIKAGNAKPVASSPIVTSKTPGHAVSLKADISGAKQLFLIVRDGGNGFSCDWADWAEPRLSGPDGEKKLTDMKWKASTTQYGQVRVDKNAGNQPMKIGGTQVVYGIGTHANSVIQYDLPANHKFKTFEARVGLDNGGTDQGACGDQSSVQFHVFTAPPLDTYLSAPAAAEPIAAASHDSADAVEQLEVHDGLTATLFASEPMMTNPAAMDIDHLGRVWVCEAINYRDFRNKDVIGDRKVGDRILVLEDTDHDAKADKSTVFYQGHDIDSAHGILVLPTPDGKGLKAIVSALDSVFFLHDDDGDLKSDRKELLFTGISGSQHDHGIHAFHFGPDGKLYFNFGNAGKQIKDKDGKPIVDKMGNEVNSNRKPYQEGMIFRCNLDGSEFETLAWNFRNNWEVCVDSFGTMWQSDNDDDGNRGVRINYVLEYGNYGYKDEFTGAGWKEPRTGWEEEIPHRHWHLNDPGVVPNLIQTGQGAPTGICIYEGELLPEVFRGQPLHTDAGPNICRAYITKRVGSGYTATIENILDGVHNKWFRPSDVCVAPDGSVLIADWYDPGVGGHRMQDAKHGRIFRVFPKGNDAASKYQSPALDVSTPEGAIAALSSPNMSCRYLGWTALMEQGEAALPALNQMWQGDKPYLRARALWAIGKLNISNDKKLDFVVAAINSSGNVDLQVTAMRLARQLIKEIPHTEYQGRVEIQNVDDAVLREILIAMREIGGEHGPLVWGMLAQRHDGKDRWYLETLGIAAEDNWDACLNALQATQFLEVNNKKMRDIVWRSRATRTPELLAQLIADPKTPADEIPRLFRALDFQSDGETKRDAVLSLAFNELSGIEGDRASLTRAEAFNRLGGIDISKNPRYLTAVNNILDKSAGTTQFVQLVDKFSMADRYPTLLTMAQAKPTSQEAVEAIKVLYSKQQHELLGKAMWSDDRDTVTNTLTALATAADNRSVGALTGLMNDEGRPVFVRRGAVDALSASLPGAKALLKVAQEKKYPDSLKETVAASLTSASWRVIREPAEKLFPAPPSKDMKPIPTLAELSVRKGNLANGRVIFNTTATCNKCHIVNGIGTDIGPDLSEIGKKLTRPALYESILFPSAGVSHNYESYLIQTDEGQSYTGLIISESDTEVKLKDEKGIIRTIKTASIEGKKKQDISLMPGNLQKLMTVDELVDVVEYLTTLKKKKS